MFAVLVAMAECSSIVGLTEKFSKSRLVILWSGTDICYLVCTYQKRRPILQG